VEVSELEPNLDVVRCELGSPAQVCDRLGVREQPLRARACAHEVLDCLRPRLADVQVAGEQLDDVVARPVQRLGHFGDSPVQVALLTPQQARVRDLLDEGVVEGHGRLAVLVEAVDEGRGDEVPELVVELGAVRCDCAQQLEPDASPDHRGRLQQGARSARQEIDASGEQSLDRRRNRVCTPAVAHRPAAVRRREVPGLLERAHELLGEERVAARSLLDHGRKLSRRRSVQHCPDQLLEPRDVERAEAELGARDGGSRFCDVCVRLGALGPDDQVDGERRSCAHARELLGEGP
jgi:hypothetical protein